MKTRKSWREKLEKVQEPQVKETPKGLMLIPRGLDVEDAVRRIPAGKLATVTQIRDRLAEDHGADYTCPLVSGIFLRIVAEAAEEELSQGVKKIAPYWRVVRADGSLNDKYPGGAAAQAAYLREEGHEIEAGRGKTMRVRDYREFLV